jgi:hypothetical protein
MFCWEGPVSGANKETSNRGDIRENVTVYFRRAHNESSGAPMTASRSSSRPSISAVRLTAASRSL